MKVKLDYLTDGSRRLHGLYDKSMQNAKSVQNELDTCLARQSKTQVCEGTGQKYLSIYALKIFTYKNLW